MEKRRPNTSQTKYFVWKGCIFWVVQHLPKSVQNTSKRHPEMTPKSAKLDRRPPKSDAKNKHGNWYTKNAEKNNSEPKMTQNTSQNRTESFCVLGFVWYLLPRWRQEASRSPLDPPNHNKIFKKTKIEIIFCTRTQYPQMVGQVVWGCDDDPP